MKRREELMSLFKPEACRLCCKDSVYPRCDTKCVDRKEAQLRTEGALLMQEAKDDLITKACYAFCAANCGKKACYTECDAKKKFRVEYGRRL